MAAAAPRKQAAARARAGSGASSLLQRPAGPSGATVSGDAGVRRLVRDTAGTLYEVKLEDDNRVRKRCVG